MVIGAHNAWTFLRPQKWWMRLIAFTARCQRKTIKEQYDLGVRNFDLRIKVVDNVMSITHGIITYCSLKNIENDLIFLHLMGDCSIRINLDVRTKRALTNEQIQRFRTTCKYLNNKYNGIRFWSGDDLYTHKSQYSFDYFPTAEEHYASVSKPKWIDDWFPWIYAHLNNKKILKNKTNKDILIIDFVDYGH